MSQLNQTTLLGLMLAAWLGEAAMLLPLSRCRHAGSAVLCLLAVAIGQLLCSATLSSEEEWPIAFGGGAVVVAGVLQALSWLLLLPAVFLCGFASSITLSSLLSLPVWWLIVWVCGAERWLSCDVWETLTVTNLLLGLLLCALGCALATVLVGWRVKGACAESVSSQPSRVAIPRVPRVPHSPQPLVSILRSHTRSAPSRLHVQCYPISLDLRTASPVTSNHSSPAGRDSPDSAISSSTSSASSASYSSPLDFLPTDWQSSPSQSPFSHLDDGEESHHQYYDAIALETENSDDERKDERLSKKAPSHLCDISVLPVVELPLNTQLKDDGATVKTMPRSLPFPFSHFLSTPVGRVTATAVSCLSSAVFHSFRLVPLYAETPYGLERLHPMGPYMIGVSATTSVCLALTCGAYSFFRVAQSRPQLDSKDGTAPRAGPLQRSASATALLRKATTTATSAANSAVAIHSLLLSPLPFLLPTFLCFTAGAASALSFAFFQHLLQLPAVFHLFTWYSTGYLNDHYSPLTALVPAGVAAIAAALLGRLIDGASSGRSTGGVGAGRVVAVWLMAMVLGSMGNFWLISNGLLHE